MNKRKQTIESKKMTTGILSTHGDSVVCYLFDDELKWQQKHSRNFGIVFVFFFFGGRPNSNQICIDYIEIPYSFAILRALILSFFWLKKKRYRTRYLYWIHKMANFANKINITRKITQTQRNTKTIFTWESFCVECNSEFPSLVKILLFI